MSKHRAIPYGSPIPQSFLDAMQEFIGTMASPNLLLMMVPGSGNQIQIVAGTGSAQVGLGIDGVWRYNSATTQATITGAAGTFDIFAITANNSFAVNSTPPPPETDSTVYAFTLQALTQGSTPGSAHYRKIGEAVFDGTRVLNLRQTIGADGAQLAQPGDIKLSAAASLPAGWLRCDGSLVSRTTYAALYAALGGTGSPWGQGDGSTTFNLPDLQGRVPVGSGNGGGLTGRPLAQYGGGTLDIANPKKGEELHALGVQELPVHNHGGATGGGTTGGGTTGTESADHSHGPGLVYNRTDATGGGVLNFNGAGSGFAFGLNYRNLTGRDTAHTHSFAGVAVPALAIPNQGNNVGHNTMQPFAVCSYWIKT